MISDRDKPDEIKPSCLSLANIPVNLDGKTGPPPTNTESNPFNHTGLPTLVICDPFNLAESRETCDDFLSKLFGSRE